MNCPLVFCHRDVHGLNELSVNGLNEISVNIIPHNVHGLNELSVNFHSSDVKESIDTTSEIGIHGMNVLNGLGTELDQKQ